MLDNSLLGTLSKEITEKITGPLNNQKLERSKLTVFMTLGLPASGKTTWAIEHIKNNPGTVRVNKDTLRLMIFNGQYSKEMEEFVCIVRDIIIDHALGMGYDVVVDDTNFKEDHRKRIKEIADFYGATIEIKHFTDVPLAVCFERNAKRENPVPEEAIQRMYDMYLKDSVDSPRA